MNDVASHSISDLSVDRKKQLKIYIHILTYYVILWDIVSLKRVKTWWNWCSIFLFLLLDDHDNHSTDVTTSNGKYELSYVRMKWCLCHVKNIKCMFFQFLAISRGTHWCRQPWCCRWYIHSTSFWVNISFITAFKHTLSIIFWDTTHAICAKDMNDCKSSCYLLLSDWAEFSKNSRKSWIESSLNSFPCFFLFRWWRHWCPWWWSQGWRWHRLVTHSFASSHHSCLRFFSQNSLWDTNETDTVSDTVRV